MKGAAMSIIKSISVGYGDMFYIKHNSDNFTIIDCMLPDDSSWRGDIIEDIAAKSKGKGIVRFISTHPDQDHVQGLEDLDTRMHLLNFYCIKNAITKDDPTSDFYYYCSLRDDQQKAFYIHKGCSRRWMNQASPNRGHAGINILWPDTSNPDFQEALKSAEQGENPNNTSAIIKYSLNAGATALWMGDLETEFMEKIDGYVSLPQVDLLFAPHHGRKSGRVPSSWLDQMEPTVIILGEAESENIYYYPGWNTITQNSAGDVVFDCVVNRVDVYVSSATYTVDFLHDAGASANLGYYIGSFNV